MEISNSTLSEFVKDFKKAVEPLQEKYDVTISLGRISYEEERFSTKMTVNNGRDSEQIARDNFDADVWRYAHLGFTMGMYRRIFIGADDKRYAILGFNTRASRYPLICYCIDDGEHVKTGEHFVKEILNEHFV